MELAKLVAVRTHINAALRGIEATCSAPSAERLAAAEEALGHVQAVADAWAGVMRSEDNILGLTAPAALAQAREGALRTNEGMRKVLEPLRAELDRQEPAVEAAIALREIPDDSFRALLRAEDPATLELMRTAGSLHSRLVGGRLTSLHDHYTIANAGIGAGQDPLGTARFLTTALDTRDSIRDLEDLHRVVGSLRATDGAILDADGFARLYGAMFAAPRRELFDAVRPRAGLSGMASEMSVAARNQAAFASREGRMHLAQDIASLRIVGEDRTTADTLERARRILARPELDAAGENELISMTTLIPMEMRPAQLLRMDDDITMRRNSFKDYPEPGTWFKESALRVLRTAVQVESRDGAHRGLLGVLAKEPGTLSRDDLLDIAVYLHHLPTSLRPQLPALPPRYFDLGTKDGLRFIGLQGTLATLSWHPSMTVDEFQLLRELFDVPTARAASSQVTAAARTLKAVEETDPTVRRSALLSGLDAVRALEIRGAKLPPAAAELDRELLRGLAEGRPVLGTVLDEHAFAAMRRSLDPTVSEAAAPIAAIATASDLYDLVSTASGNTARASVLLEHARDIARVLERASRPEDRVRGARIAAIVEREVPRLDAFREVPSDAHLNELLRELIGADGAAGKLLLARLDVQAARGSSATDQQLADAHRILRILELAGTPASAESMRKLDEPLLALLRDAPDRALGSLLREHSLRAFGRVEHDPMIDALAPRLLADAGDRLGELLERSEGAPLSEYVGALSEIERFGARRAAAEPEGGHVRALLDGAVELATANRKRIDGTGSNSGYLNYPDYAEVGKVRSQLRMVQQLDGMNATPAVSGGERISW